MTGGQWKQRGAMLAMVLAAGGSIGFAQAQTQSADWPTHALRIIVVAAPGGLPDIAARNIAAALAKPLGQPVLVENRGGGAGNIASDVVAKAPPDGYTLLATGTNQAVNQVLVPNPGFAYNRDLAPVALIAESNMLLIAGAGFKPNTVREVLELAHANPNKVSMAVSVLGSPNHVGAELLASLGHAELTFISYKGVGATMPDLMAGNVDLAISALPGSMGLVKSGRMKALAVTRLKRAPQMPEVPTIDESGLPGFEINSWVALMTTGGTPPAVIERLGLEARRAMQSPELRSIYDKQGLEPSMMTPTELGAFIRAEVTKWTPVLKNARMKAEDQAR